MSKKGNWINMVVYPGRFVPADNHAIQDLRLHNLSNGQHIQVQIHKIRNKGTWKHAHNIGALCIEHIDAFANYHDNHDVLKRLQYEGNIACDEIAASEEDGLLKIHRVPRSLAFDRMSDDEFEEVLKSMYVFICNRYWPSMTPEGIEEMALAFDGGN